jgi:hypothetical protein
MNPMPTLPGSPLAWSPAHQRRRAQRMRLLPGQQAEPRTESGSADPFADKAGARRQSLLQAVGCSASPAADRAACCARMT